MAQETCTTRLSDLVGQGMIWSKPDWKKGVYELRFGEKKVATLRFRSMWGTFATGETEEGSWTFKRVGFFQNRVTIRSADSDPDVGVFVNDWKMGGTLELPDGRRYRANSNFWMTSYAFTNEAGQPLVSFSRVGGITLSAAMEIHPAAADLGELPWLVMLGWYLAVMLHNDSAVAGGGAGGGVAG